MKSPFPGMDPYLERSWGDVHTRLVTSSSTALNKLLPPDLIARVEERVGIESSSGADEPMVRTNLIPDARVFESFGEGGVPHAQGGQVALAPYRLELLDELPTERFVEIIDVNDSERLITVIEFVSPSNKKSDGLRVFIEKRNTLVSGGVNFVEIDLVRDGNWRRLLGQYRIPAGGISSYRAVIHVPGTPPETYLHPMPLRMPLPTIKVPLRPTDMPCDLALQPLIADVYEAGRYDRTRYEENCDPALEGDDAAWAEEILRAAGRRRA